MRPIRANMTPEAFKTEIIRISNRIAASESRMQRKFDPASRIIEGVPMWKTSAPNRGAYLSTLPDKFALFLLKLEPGRFNPDFRQRRAGVLGAGLGPDALVLSHFFESVVAWEYDPVCCRLARRGAKKMGHPYDKISFREKDILTLSDRELKGFDLFYFFEPFFEDFGPKMGELLSRTHSGSFVCSHILTSMELYPSVYNPMYFINRSSTSPLLAMFDVYERK